MVARAPLVAEMQPSLSDEARAARRDRIEKLREYAAFGVRWYWLLDPAMRTLEIYELGADQRYTWAMGASGGKIEEVPGCEGLALDLDALWVELDRLGDEVPREGDAQE